jgi:hypothetical protein
MLFPAQIAGAIFSDASWAGAFHGTMARTNRSQAALPLERWNMSLLPGASPIEEQ